MKNDSIEEKKIYEKLMADIKKTANKMNDDYIPKLGITNTTDFFNMEHLMKLQSEINCYKNTLNRTKDSTCIRPITSFRKIIKPIVVFVKRAVRKFTYWFIEPICEQQTVFNSAVVPSVDCIIKMNDELLKGLIQLEQKMHKLKAENEQQLQQIRAELEHKFKD